MHQSPESITDDDLYQLITDVDQSTLDSMEAERIYELACDILWDAIEEGGIPISVCRDPEQNDEAMDALIQLIITDNLLGGQEFETPEECHEAAVEIAEGFWDVETNILDRLIVCIEDQLIAEPLGQTDSEALTSTRKKRFMADLIAEGHMSTMYFDLANATLEGEPLRPEDDDYIDFCSAAICQLDNQDKTPQRQLYSQLRTTLGIPADGLLPGAPYSEAESVAFIELDSAAESILVAAVLHPGESVQGIRHKDICEILAEFTITDPSTRQAIFDLTDHYREPAQ